MDVRHGRHGIELRVDGTLASLHRPDGGVTGVVWWALAAPVLFLPPGRRPRVLMLGLAGGSVARAIRALEPAAEIVGVEKSPEVVRQARRHLGLDRLNVELVVGDAMEFLNRDRRRFDLIVEDLFVGTSRRVRKPEGLLEDGYPLFGRHLSRGGIAVSNTIHEMPAVVRAMAPLPGRVVSMDVDDHWNRIVVSGASVPPPQRIRQVLSAHPSLRTVLPHLAVRTRG